MESCCLFLGDNFIVPPCINVCLSIREEWWLMAFEFSLRASASKTPHHVALSLHLGPKGAARSATDKSMG